MKLSDYLSETQTDPGKFAFEIGQTERAVESWLAGDRRPRWEALVRIAEVTGGKVTANDFMPTTATQPEAAE